MRLPAGRTARLCLVAVFAALALAGCGSKGKARLPAKLVRVAHPQVSAENVWSRGVGNGGGGYYSDLRVALAEDALFVAGENGRVMALQPGNGKVLWKTLVKGRVISGPTVNGDAILLGTLDGEVIALKRADGKPLWRSKAPSEARWPSPVGSGDVVVAKGSGWALSDGHGRRHRRAQVELRPQRAQPDPARSVRPADPGQAHLHRPGDSGASCSVPFNLDDGKLIWEQTISVPTGRGELERLTDIDADLLPTPDGFRPLRGSATLAWRPWRASTSAAGDKPLVHRLQIKRATAA